MAGCYLVGSDFRLYRKRDKKNARAPGQSDQMDEEGITAATQQ
jgi:hypothetical protein